MKTVKSHRGAILHKAVKESGMSVSQLVKKMKLSRTSYYNHINDAALSFELLQRYGRAINYNFSPDIPEMPEYAIVSEPGEKYLSVSQLQRDRDHWKEKYLQLLERYNNLLERQKG